MEFSTELVLLGPQMGPEVRSGNPLKKPFIVLNRPKTKQSGAVPTLLLRGKETQPRSLLRRKLL